MVQFRGTKSWFKVEDSDRQVMALADDCELVKETEKAVCFKFSNEDFGSKDIWFPKAALLTDEDFKAKAAAFESGCNKYDNLIKIGRDNGVKVRAHSKVGTIVEAFIAAGKLDLIDSLVEKTGYRKGHVTYKLV